MALAFKLTQERTLSEFVFDFRSEPNWDFVSER